MYKRQTRRSHPRPRLHRCRRRCLRPRCLHNSFCITAFAPTAIAPSPSPKPPSIRRPSPPSLSPSPPSPSPSPPPPSPLRHRLYPHHRSSCICRISSLSSATETPLTASTSAAGASTGARNARRKRPPLPHPRLAPTHTDVTTISPSHTLQVWWRCERSVRSACSSSGVLRERRERRVGYARRAQRAA